jgi:hypothetical protein
VRLTEVLVSGGRQSLGPMSWFFKYFRRNFL